MHLQELCADTSCWYSVLRTLDAPVSPKSLLCLNSGRLLRLCLGSSWCYCSLELSRQQPTNKAHLICFFSQGSVSCAAYGSMAANCFTFFVFCCYYLKWEDKSRSCYAIKLYFKDNLENLRHRISGGPGIKLSSLMQGTQNQLWSGN